MKSIAHNNTILDFKFKKHALPFIYNFYLGNIFIGQIFKIKSNSWSAIPFHTPSPYGAIDGFKSRDDAAMIMLKICGFIRCE
jgi:hypothetical protein